jgi:uncharacterized protein (TIGR00266 family)
MKYKITGKPDFALLELDLEAGEQCLAEPGAMVAMSANMKMKTEMKGGLLAGIKRKLAGENFMTNTYTSEGAPGTIKFAPSIPGDVEALELNGGTYLMQAGAYVAHTGEVDIDMKFGGAKSFFAGEGFILLKISGTGTVFFASYGALKKVKLEGSYIVDTTHIVAFPETVTYNVRPVGGLKATFLSGEGLVCDFSGEGDIYIQTRSAPAFGGWVNPFRPVKTKSN